MKTFIARGNSFAAKPGEHDDLVMSMLIAIRMVTYIGTFEDDVYSMVNSSLGLDDAFGGALDEYDEPMPMF
jgi:hypothetical protein